MKVLVSDEKCNYYLIPEDRLFEWDDINEGKKIPSWAERIPDEDIPESLR